MLLVLIVYCGILLAIGLYASRSVKKAEDFFVAGRSLSPGLLFSTFLAANLGAGSTVGAAEFGYSTGLSAWWWVGSAGIGSLVLAYIVGPRIYVVAKRYDLYTVGDYLEHRYGRRTRIVAAAILQCGSPAILAGQIIAMGLVLRVVAGIPEPWGAVLGGTVATAYFSLGGLRSAAWVNLAQVVVKVSGFLIAVPWILNSVGGWAAVADAAPNPEYLSVTGAGLDGTTRLLLMLAPAFFTSPGLIQKLYGAKDESTVRKGVGLQSFCLLGYAFMPVLLGMAARAHFGDLEVPGTALLKLLAEATPLWLGALMLAAIFSAEVSSADAVLFMMTTSLVKDILEPLQRVSRSDRWRLKAARVSAILFGAIGIFLALQFQSILAVLSFFYGLVTVTLCVPLLAGLFSSKARESTALVSIALSLGAAALVHFATAGEGFGLMSPVAAGIVVSATVFWIDAPRHETVQA